MIEITKENIEKAIERAKQSKPLVRVIQFRTYAVTNRETGATYEVKFTKANGKKLAECNCKCGMQSKFVCKHIAASLNIHLVLASQMKTATV